MQHAALAEEKCHGPLWSKYLKGVVTEKEAEKCVELYHLMKEKYIPDWEAAMAKRNKNIMIPKKNGIKTSPKDKN